MSAEGIGPLMHGPLIGKRLRALVSQARAERGEPDDAVPTPRETYDAFLRLNDGPEVRAWRQRQQQTADELDRG